MSIKEALAYIILGIFVASLGYYLAPKLWVRIQSRTKLIKYYWIFAIIYCAVFIPIYICVYKCVDPNNRSDAISMTNQASSITFGIFVGYFAFVQVMEARKEKYIELGANMVAQDEYKRAVGAWEEANKIDPKDQDNLVNLIEMMIILKDYDSASKLMPKLEKLKVGKNNISYNYLVFLDAISQERLRDAKQAIVKTVEYVKANSTSLESFRFNFSDMQKSSIYTDLSGDSKKLTDNYIVYINNAMSEERKQSFESGDYLSPLT